MGKALHYNQNELGEYEYVVDLPQARGMVYYTYCTDKPVQSRGLSFDISPGWNMVILQGERTRDALRLLKLAVYHGSALEYDGDTIYPLAIGYKEADNDSPLTVVATIGEPDAD